jgi:threonine/homoserine/homoserine lactone efflux protein
MNGLLIVGFLFLLTFLIEKTTNLKPTINYNNKFEYIPIITANIYADLFIIFVTFAKIYINIKSLRDWYKKYRLSAMIADILIGVLYILLGRYLVYNSGLQVGLTAFAAICVFIQIIFDLLFYIFFTIIPKGSNDMLDFFKGYSKEVGAGALLGDSFLVIMAVIISALLNQSSYDTNIVFLIISVYLTPYFIYMKD